MNDVDYTQLPRVNDLALQCSADIRGQIDHFQVIEQLPFEADGSGGHVWLKIQKQGFNTDFVANELAKFSGMPQVAVGYAGMKDRHAITTQWFSVNLEGHQEPNWSEFEQEGIKIVEQTRHGKKLKRGVLAGNHFKLTLSNIKGEQALWQESLELIQQQGVPNYFGEQRFGHQMGNLYRVEHWFSTGKAPRKRNQKSIYLSAARSWLFNLVVGQRVADNNWHKPLLGDVMLLAGTKASTFIVDVVDEDLNQRVNSMDIHPTAVMWGRGEPLVQADSLALEQAVLAGWTVWKTGLEKAGMKQERRSLRLFPKDFTWQFLDNDQLVLDFFLTAGCYATSVMRELAVISDVQQRNFNKD